MGVTVIVAETLDTRDSLVMPNPKGHDDSIKDSRFKAAWQSGPTRTIRVPIALADATLEYARQLDQGVEPGDTEEKTTTQNDDPVDTASSEPRDTAGDIISPETRANTTQSRDTAGNTISPEIRVNTTQSHDTRDLVDEVTWLKAENKRLQNLLSDLRVELNDTLKNAPVVLEFEPPEAAKLLNRLKAKRKKSTASLADIEAILEMIEE